MKHRKGAGRRDAAVDGVDGVDGVDAADGACDYVYGDNGGVGRSPNPERPVGCLVSRTALPLSRISHLSRTCGSLIDWRLLPLRC